MLKSILDKLREAAVSILPISAITVLLAVTLAGVSVLSVLSFLVGAAFLVVGMGIFTLGADIAMIPIGEGIGAYLSKSKKKTLPLVFLIAAVIGFVITIAEPDLQVLGEQLHSRSIVYIVALGVGLFLVISIIKTFFNIKLSYLLLACYTLVFALGIALSIVRPDFLALAFDSGGVTTGPVTVPFLMALGVGIASVRGTRGNREDSFGTIALCSIGPILAVEIIGLLGKTGISAESAVIPEIIKAGDILSAYGAGFGIYAKEVAMALLPIAAVFFLFQIFALKLPKAKVIRIISGLVYTYLGVVIFLTGVNVGFMPMGGIIGRAVALKAYNSILIPIGMVIGAVIVLAEPAIHVLNKQVESVTGGSISKKVILMSLCIGVAVAIGLSMLRVLTGISIWWFLAPVYAVSLILTFFVPKIFIGIAFDSGGVASGPMTTTFLLPLVISVSGTLGGNIFGDAFGLVAFVAMTPLLTIQLVGMVFKFKTDRLDKKRAAEAIEKTVDDTADDTSDTVEF